jgi:parvulin-like peptidyl-prolyl isomerase
MSACLKIGDRLLDGDQVISALIRYKLLETVAGQVLLDEIISDISLSAQEVFQAITGATDAPLPEDFESFLNQWCQANGVTSVYFKAVILRELRVEKFKQLKFSNQVESEFLRLKSELDQVEYSRIQVTDHALAQELYFQLRDDGANFAALAQQYSIAPEKQIGGWIGPVPLSTLPSAIAHLFRNQALGTVHPPVVVGEQVWLVRLEHYTAARLTETTRANLVNRLYSQWLYTQVKSTISTTDSITVQSPAQPKAASLTAAVN